MCSSLTMTSITAQRKIKSIGLKSIALGKAEYWKRRMRQVNWHILENYPDLDGILLNCTGGKLPNTICFCFYDNTCTIIKILWLKNSTYFERYFIETRETVMTSNNDFSQFLLNNTDIINAECIIIQHITARYWITANVFIMF